MKKFKFRSVDTQMQAYRFRIEKIDTPNGQPPVLTLIWQKF